MQTGNSLRLCLHAKLKTTQNTTRRVLDFCTGSHSPYDAGDTEHNRANNDIEAPKLVCQYPLEEAPEDRARVQDGEEDRAILLALAMRLGVRDYVRKRHKQPPQIRLANRGLLYQVRSKQPPFHFLCVFHTCTLG